MDGWIKVLTTLSITSVEEIIFLVGAKALKSKTKYHNDVFLIV